MLSLASTASLLKVTTVLLKKVKKPIMDAAPHKVTAKATNRGSLVTIANFTLQVDLLLRIKSTCLNTKKKH